MLNLRISPNGVELIKKWEGCRLTAYQDGGGVWTIGYGTTKYPQNRKPVCKGDHITQAQAAEYLKIDLSMAESFVAMKVKSFDVTQFQFDALVSLTYNIGIRAFYNSSLLKAINLWPEDPEIEELFLRWRYDNGHEIQGLINRRKSEAHYYRTGEIKTEFEN